MSESKYYIMGYPFVVENIPYEAVKPVPEKPIKQLICCCCGNYTPGRQWWNRDKGYGLCSPCAERISKCEDAETMKSCYGVSGIHYNVVEDETIPSV